MVHVFCPREAWVQCHASLTELPQQPEWQLQEEGVSRTRFLRSFRRWLRPELIERLWINTASDNYWQLARICGRLDSSKVVLMLHSIEAYFSPRLQFNLRRIVRVTGKWLLRRTIRQYAVQSRALLPALRRYLPPGCPVYWIPGCILPNGPEPSTPAPFPLHLVVAGSIDERRRRYADVEQLIDLLEKGTRPYRISLLGKPANAEMRQWVDQLRTRTRINVEVAFFDDRLIEQEEYDRVLASAHFIFHPSPSQAVLEDGAVETYGLTVQSGVFADAVRHALPLWVPATLPFDAAVEPMRWSYTSIPQLAQQLAQIDSAEQYQPFHQAAQLAVRAFTVDHIRRYNPALFTGI